MEKIKYHVFTHGSVGRIKADLFWEAFTRIVTGTDVRPSRSRLYFTLAAFTRACSPVGANSVSNSPSTLGVVTFTCWAIEQGDSLQCRRKEGREERGREGGRREE